MKRIFANVVVPIGFLTLVACGARSPLDSMDDGTGESNGGAGGILLGGGGHSGAGGFTLNTTGFISSGGRPTGGSTLIITTGGFIGSGGRPATGGGFITTGGRINTGGAYGGYIVDGGSGGHGGYTLLGGSIPAGGQTITGGRAGGIAGNAGGSGGGPVPRGGSGGGAGMIGGAAGTRVFDGGFGGSGGFIGDGGPRDLSVERGDARLFGDVIATGGSSAAGGSMATGGSGGTIACQGPSSNEEMIDDLNDGDRFIPKINGRLGAWTDSGDSSPGGTMYPDPANPFVPTDTGDACRKYAAYVKGTGFAVSGARFGFGLGAPYDASKYTGLSFWARIDAGTTQVVRVAFPDKDTQPDGGICKTNVVGPTECYDHYGLRVNLTPTWTKYTVAFKDLGQDGWGLQGTAFDPTSLFEVQFEITVDATFSMWVDDVAFTM